MHAVLCCTQFHPNSSVVVRPISYPHISVAPTLRVRNNIFSINPKMFYSYTRNRHKNMFVRINSPSSCKKSLLKSFNCRRRGIGYAKVIHTRKKKRKKRKCIRKKWTSVWDIENNGYLDASLRKREMNKIAHVFLQRYFQVSNKRDMFQGA